MTNRGSMWALLLGVCVLGAAGCGQSYGDAMQLICRSAAEPQVAAAPDAPAKITAASVLISEQVTNAEARSMWQSLAPLPPREKAAKVRAAAKRAGVAECPLTTIWTAS